MNDEGRSARVAELRESLDKLGDGETSSASRKLTESLSAFLSEAVFSLETPLDDYIDCLKQFFSYPSQETSVKLQTSLLDVFWSLDLALESAGQSWPAATASEDASPGRLRIRQILVKLQDEIPLALQKQRIGLQVATDPSTEGRVVQGEIRARTAMFYKQQKFNLLREEAEGYAKLTMTLLSHMGPAHDSKTALSVETAQARLQRAKIAMQDIQSLIGYFDLDPTRSLDIFFDIFSDHITHHHSFFRDLLRISPWGKPDADHVDSTADPDAVDEGSSIEPDGSLPKTEAGNYICSQVLGFKFRFYQSQDSKSSTPEKLYLLAAILIRDGFVRMSDLYSHLSPTDTVMPSVQTKWTSSLAEKAREGSSNALSLAGALDGSGLSGSASTLATEKEAEKPKDPPNQKAGLLKACLTIGDFTSAMFILCRFPWLLGPFPDIADLFLRILDKLIQPAYEAFCKSAEADEQNTQLLSQSFGIQSDRYSNGIRISSPMPTYALTGRGIHVGRSNLQYTFFFPEWQDTLPILQDQPQQMLDTVLNLLKFIGPAASRDLSFLNKLLRIGATLVSSRTIEKMEDGAPWTDVLRMHILPALTVAEPNPGLTLSLWTILVHFPYTLRYSFYGEWKERTAKLCPEVKLKRAQADKSTKALLKRLGSDAAKRFGRQFAKIAHSDPCTIFTIAINQIQSYENLIQPIVEAARYLSAFEYDVMSYTMLEALSDPSRQRIKKDGLHEALWLSGLSEFVASLHKRWSFDVSLPIQYCLKQLTLGNTTDLLVLREIIKQMGSVEAVAPADVSETGLWALCGGPTLRAESAQPMTLALALSKVSKKALPKHALRLQAALVGSSLGRPMLMRIASQRQSSVFESAQADASQLRSLANSHDQIHASFLQFVDYLKSTSLYDSVAPTLQEAWQTYAILPSIAFHITRPLMASELRRVDLENLDNNLDVPAAEIDSVGNEAKWSSVLQDNINLATQMLPDVLQKFIHPGFFITFWTLDLYDIYLPSKTYQDLRTRLDSISDEARSLNLSTAELDQVKVKIQFQSLTLDTELQAQKKSIAATRKRLVNENALWFPGSASHRKQISEQLMQKMILPRACVSPADAIFCSRFVRFMHDIGTQNFASLMFYDKLFGEHLTPLAFHLSEDEARNYGRFLADVLGVLSTWYKSESRYTDEALGSDVSPSGTRMRVGFIQRASALSNLSTISSSDFLAHTKYRTAYSKWQRNACSALRTCIESSDYMNTRNGLLILNAIAEYFPYDNRTGQMLSGVAKALFARESEANGRQDLKILASSYSAKLDRRASAWEVIASTATRSIKSNGQSDADTKAAASENGPEDINGKVQQAQLPPVSTRDVEMEVDLVFSNGTGTQKVASGSDTAAKLISQMDQPAETHVEAETGEIVSPRPRSPSAAKSDVQRRTTSPRPRGPEPLSLANGRSDIASPRHINSTVPNGLPSRPLEHTLPAKPQLDRKASDRRMDLDRWPSPAKDGDERRSTNTGVHHSRTHADDMPPPQASRQQTPIYPDTNAGDAARSRHETPTSSYSNARDERRRASERAERPVERDDRRLADSRDDRFASRDRRHRDPELSRHSDRNEDRNHRRRDEGGSRHAEPAAQRSRPITPEAPRRPSRDRDRDRERVREGDRPRGGESPAKRRRVDDEPATQPAARETQTAESRPFTIKGKASEARRLGLGVDSALEQANRDNSRSRPRSTQSPAPPSASLDSRKRNADGDVKSDLFNRLAPQDESRSRSSRSREERDTRSTRSSRR